MDYAKVFADLADRHYKEYQELCKLCIDSVEKDYKDSPPFVKVAKIKEYLGTARATLYYRDVCGVSISEAKDIVSSL